MPDLLRPENEDFDLFSEGAEKVDNEGDGDDDDESVDDEEMEERIAQ